LVIELVDSQFSYGNTLDAKYPGRFDFAIQLSDATKRATVKEPSDFPIRQIGHEVQRQRSEIDQTEELMAARAGMGLAVGKLEWLSDTNHRQWTVRASNGKDRLNRLKMEPHRRWASGFCCLFFVWLGIPLSIWMKSADNWTSFGTCFVPTVLIYYPIFTVGLNHARDGSWTPAAVWIGNVALLIVGAWWMRRIYRTT
jgi:lipopolysaccharide export system permease protein